MTSAAWSRKQPDDQWSAFCALCLHIVAEGTEHEVKADFELHRAANHPEVVAS